MLHLTARVPRFRGPCGLVLAGLCLAAALPAALHAQLLRGTVLGKGDRAPLAGATIEALDSVPVLLANARTDSAGRFALRLPGPGRFRLQVRRLGIVPTETDWLRFESPADTVTIELTVEVDATALSAVEVSGRRDAPSLNAFRLSEARANGWRVIGPERVAPHRDRAQRLDQLLQSIGAPSMTITRTCLRSTLTNGCMTVFVDDQYYGATGWQLIIPSDIEFVAVINPADALARFGNRARDGVVMLYTRRGTDRRRDP